MWEQYWNIRISINIIDFKLTYVYIGCPKKLFPLKNGFLDCSKESTLKRECELFGTPCMYTCTCVHLPYMYNTHVLFKIIIFKDIMNFHMHDI